MDGMASQSFSFKEKLLLIFVPSFSELCVSPLFSHNFSIFDLEVNETWFVSCINELPSLKIWITVGTKGTFLFHKL